MVQLRPYSRSSLDRSGWHWLLLATLLMCFSNGRTIVPAAAWWSPLFLLRFVRTRQPAAGLGTAFVVTALVSALAWRRMIPLEGMRYLGVTTAMAAISILPYAADRRVTSRLRGFASTLVFPMAWAAVDFLSAWGNPFGTWGSVAYTQADNLPLLQIASVTGLAGVVFVVAWFASVVNWAWDRGFEVRKLQPGALIFLAIMAVVLLGGGCRLALAPPRAETVRVASLTVIPTRPPEIWRASRGRLTDGETQSIRRDAWALLDSLLEKSRREARAGARMIVWSEGSAACLKQDEPELIERVASMARGEGVHVFAAVVTFTPGQPRHENQLLAFDPTGRLAFRYHKARPTPGDAEIGADRRLPTLSSSLGRVGGAICFDMDFPDLVRQEGRARADIIVAPSSDWRAIDPLHTRMALVRGVENGCSVVRPTAMGLSAAADYEGRVLAAVDYFRSSDHVMVAQVPARGVRTIYARVGNLFAWLCVVGLAVAGVVASQTPRT